MKSLFHLLGAAAALSPPVARPSGAPWHLVSPVRVPDYLDREALLLPQGQNGLLASPNHCWAELLSQSVPRLLAQDLGLLGGEGSLWTGAAPRGLAVRRQLRVELLALDVNAAATAVTLKVGWTTNASEGTAQPVACTHGVALTAHSLGTYTDSAGQRPSAGLVAAGPGDCQNPGIGFAEKLTWPCNKSQQPATNR